MPPMDAVLEENRSLKQEIAVLRAQIEWFKKKIFGGGKSDAARQRGDGEARRVS